MGGTPEQRARLRIDAMLQRAGLPGAAGAQRRPETEAEGKAWRRINRLVTRIAPGVKALSPVLAGSGVRLDWIDDQDGLFGAHQLSDGTLRAIALVTALARPTSSSRAS